MSQEARLNLRVNLVVPSYAASMLPVRLLSDTPSLGASWQPTLSVHLLSDTPGNKAPPPRRSSCTPRRPPPTQRTRRTPAWPNALQGAKDAKAQARAPTRCPAPGPCPPARAAIRGARAAPPRRAERLRLAPGSRRTRAPAPRRPWPSAERRPRRGPSPRAPRRRRPPRCAAVILSARAIVLRNQARTESARATVAEASHQVLLLHSLGTKYAPARARAPKDWGLALFG